MPSEGAGGVAGMGVPSRWRGGEDAGARVARVRDGREAPAGEGWGSRVGGVKSRKGYAFNVLITYG